MTGPAPTPLDALIDLAVDRAITRLLPHIANPRPMWTTPKNAPALFGGKTWRAVDEWAQRRRIRRHKAAGSPCYRTADLDAAVEATDAIANDTDDVARAARLRAAKKGGAPCRRASTP